MPDTNRRRRRRRLLPATAAGAIVAGAALFAPASASAYQQHFCQYVVLPSGTNCHAVDRHSLFAVHGFSWGSYDRVCVTTHTSPLGSQNSTWLCDYGDVSKNFSSRVDGVGTIRNGDPQTFTSYAIQEF